MSIKFLTPSLIGTTLAEGLSQYGVATATSLFYVHSLRLEA